MENYSLFQSLKVVKRFFGPIGLVTVAFSVLAITGGCVTNVHTDYEHSADFSAYSSFKVDPRAERQKNDSIVLSEIVDRRIESALRQNLRAKGFEEVAENPELRINFFVVTRTRTEVIDRSPFAQQRRSARYPRGYYSRLWFPDFEINEYEEGTLVVDIVDREQDRLMWRGTYTRRVGWSSPDEAATAKMIGKILNDFPPTPR